MRGVGLGCIVSLQAALLGCSVDKQSFQPSVDAPTTDAQGQHDASETVDAPAQIDAPQQLDAAPAVDAAGAQCGDGIHVVGEVCFAPPIALGTGLVSKDARFADTDGDGDMDVVVVGDNYRVHFRSGAQFPTSTVLAPDPARFLLARDLNADGKAELFGANVSEWDMWRNTGAGSTYTMAGAINVAGQLAGGVVFANLDALAPTELVTIYTMHTSVGKLSTGSSPVMTEGNSVGVIATKTTIAAGRTSDGDLRDDVVIGGDGGIWVLHGSTTAGFENASPPPLTTRPVLKVGLGDIDGDSRLDIVFLASGEIGVMLGLAGGQFTSPTFAPVANAIATAWDVNDVDGDGRADVLLGVTTGSSHGIEIRRGGTDGTLGQPVNLPLAAPIDVIHVDGDANGDGVVDMVATRSSPVSEALVFMSAP